MNTLGTQHVMYGNAGHTDAVDCRTARCSDFPNLRLSANLLENRTEPNFGITNLTLGRYFDP